MQIHPLYLATTLLAAASTVAASPLPSKNQGLETREAAAAHVLPSEVLPLRSSDIEIDQRSSNIELDQRSSEIEIDTRNLANDLHLTVSDIESEQGAPRQKHHDGGTESKVLPLVG